MKTKTTIKDLVGKDIKGSPTMGEAIANILLSAKEGGKMKLYILAQKFHNDETVELDKVDMELVKKAVEQSEIYNNLVTGQILSELTE